MSGLSGKKKVRILLLCPYPLGVAPGQRLKYEQYLDFLREEGFEIRVSSFMGKELWDVLYRPGHFIFKTWCVLKGYVRRLIDIARLPFYDGAYIFLHASPFGGPLVEALCLFTAKKVIYDIDDLVYLGRVSSQNKIVGWLKSPSKFKYLIRKSDHVITCTPYLDSYVRKYNSSTTDISSTIQTRSYVPSNRYKNDRTLVIGWSGSHSTIPYLRLLDSVFLKLYERYPFKLRVIGTSQYLIPGIEVEALPWREETEVEELQQIDVGVYPLPDEEWVYGKSGLKALQYMALGIPTVASAIGANFRVIEDGVSGYLVKTEEEWVDRLHALLLNPSLRKSIGQAARARVQERFSVDANKMKYLSVFKDVYGSGPSP